MLLVSFLHVLAYLLHGPQPSPHFCRFAHIEKLNQQQGQLAQRRDELAQRLGDAQQALQSAQQEQQRVQEVRKRQGVAATSRLPCSGADVHVRLSLAPQYRCTLGPLLQLMASKEKGLGLGGPPPSSIRSAEKALATARRAAEAAAAAEAPEALEARYGSQKAQSTVSIDRLLQSGVPGCRTARVRKRAPAAWEEVRAAASGVGSGCCGPAYIRHHLPPVPGSPTAGDPGLVGVFAQLATVDDAALSAVLAGSYRSMLTTVVLADSAARQRLSALLAQKRLAPPDMLPMSMLVAGAAKAGDSPGFAGASERAHALQRAACRGADPPLALPLPHTIAISKMRDRGEWLAWIVLVHRGLMTQRCLPSPLIDCCSCQPAGHAPQRTPPPPPPRLLYSRRRGHDCHRLAARLPGLRVQPCAAAAPRAPRLAAVQPAGRGAGV